MNGGLKRTPPNRGKPLGRGTPLGRGSAPLQRKTGLAPGKPLTQKTPLRSTKPLQQGKPLKNGTPITNSTGGLGAKGTTKPRSTLKSRPAKVTPEERSSRKLVEARSGGVCEKCARKPATDKAHRQSRGVGGAWCPSNLLDLCRDCHRGNHDHPQRAYDGGWHLRSHTTPTKEPVLFSHEGRRGWALLAENGGFVWLPEGKETST